MGEGATITGMICLTAIVLALIGMTMQKNKR